MIEKTMKSVSLLLVALTVACGGSSPSPTTPTPTPPPPAAPTVTALSVVGCGCTSGGMCTAPANCALTATATLSNGTTQAVTTQAAWNSTNPSVAEVASNGTVIVRNAGGADITAVYQGKLAGVTLTVPSPWSQGGSGNNVFDMPMYVSRVRVTARYAGYSSNFIVHINGRSLINELLGTGWGPTTYDGTHLVSGGTVEVLFSAGVAWNFTQMR